MDNDFYRDPLKFGCQAHHHASTQSYWGVQSLISNVIPICDFPIFTTNWKANFKKLEIIHSPTVPHYVLYAHTQTHITYTLHRQLPNHSIILRALITFWTWLIFHVFSVLTPNLLQSSYLFLIRHKSDENPACK